MLASLPPSFLLPFLPTCLPPPPSFLPVSPSPFLPLPPPFSFFPSKSLSWLTSLNIIWHYWSKIKTWGNLRKNSRRRVQTIRKTHIFQIIQALWNIFRNTVVSDLVMSAHLKDRFSSTWSNLCFSNSQTSWKLKSHFFSNVSSLVYSASILLQGATHNMMVA